MKINKYKLKIIFKALKQISYMEYFFLRFRENRAMFDITYHNKE